MGASQLDAISDSSATEMSIINKSVIHAQILVSKKALDTALPRPPSRTHLLRHSLPSLYYHRPRKLEGYRFCVECEKLAAAFDDPNRSLVVAYHLFYTSSFGL